MPRYLSPEWVAAVDAAAAGGDGPGAAIVIQHVVATGPTGERRYHLVVIGKQVRVHDGQAEEPALTFTEDYATAVAISRGELSAQAAFMAGRIRISGDLGALAAASEAMVAFAGAIRSVRDVTEY